MRRERLKVESEPRVSNDGMNCHRCGTPIKKAEQYQCHSCKRIFCGKHVFSKVDGNNGAITRNAHEFCQECVEKNGGSIKD